VPAAGGNISGVQKLLSPKNIFNKKSTEIK
jgi:hypothetical protein